MTQDSSKLDPHVELVELLASEEANDRSFEALMASLRTAWVADPEFAEAEEICPGTIDLMVRITRDTLNEHRAADYAEYKRDLIALFRSELPTDQAAEAVTFYRSDVGRQLLAEIMDNISYADRVQAAMRDEDGRVDETAIKSDEERMSRQGMRAFRSADGFEAMLDLGTREWPRTMQRIQPKLNALQEAFWNADLGPEREAETERRMLDGAADHLDACFGDDHFDE